MSLSHIYKNGDSGLFLRDAVEIRDAITFGAFLAHSRNRLISPKKKSHKEGVRHLSGHLRLSGTHAEVCALQSEGSPNCRGFKVDGLSHGCGWGHSLEGQHPCSKFSPKVSKLRFSRARMQDDHILKTRLSSFKMPPAFTAL